MRLGVIRIPRKQISKVLSEVLKPYLESTQIC